MFENAHQQLRCESLTLGKATGSFRNLCRRLGAAGLVDDGTFPPARLLRKRNTRKGRPEIQYYSIIFGVCIRRLSDFICFRIRDDWISFFSYSKTKLSINI